jgi:hypothetical protein
MLLAALLVATAAVAAPGRTLDVPTDQSSARIPAAVQQRYLSMAVNEAVAKLKFEDMFGHSVALEMAGVLQMSEKDLLAYVRQAIEARIAEHGGRVVEGATEKVLARIGQGGIDRVMEQVPVKLHRSKGGPITLMSVGGGLIATGAAMMALAHDPDVQNAGLVGTISGVGLSGVGVGLLFLPPIRDIVECPRWRARVSIDASYVPELGAASTSHGDADILIETPDATCGRTDDRGFLLP